MNGTEVKRQVGYNFNLLEQHMDDVVQYHRSGSSYIGDSGIVWERFYDSFDRWAKDGQADRDGMKMRQDDQAD